MTYDDPLNPTWPQIIKRALWAYRWLLPLIGAVFFGMGAITYAVTIIHLEIATVPVLATADVPYHKNETYEYVVALAWSVIVTGASIYYMRKWKRDV